MRILAVVIAAAAIALVALMLWKCFRTTHNAPYSSAEAKPRRLRFPQAYKCTRKDAVLALIITVIYALVGFSNLGDTVAPQTFYRLTEEQPTLTVDLGKSYILRSIVYYTGSFHDVYADWKGYDLEISLDGENYFPFGVLDQNHSNTFHWVEHEFTAEDITSYGVPYGRYVRLTAHTFPLELGELVFVDVDTEAPIDPSGFSASSQLALMRLFDEQSLKPDEPSYRNSMYFDEIYHARTAREFNLGDRVYENTHPPLGKSIIALGESIFGMTPFGWRFMGVLFGVFMLPFTYVFVKNLFGKTWLASCATTVFSFDFMHYVQTRISTIDTYGLFFTILMYLFMYRFLAAGYDAPWHRRLVPLALCGISFGLGIASKWTCFYAGAGLVLLYIMGAILEGRRLYADGRGAEFWKKFGVVVAVSVVFFVIVAFGIYILSYIPFCRSNGRPFNFETIWQNQTSMFNYHSGLEATHSYQSSWWQWLIDLRPILYFRNISEDGQSSALFAAFNSPLVAWAGLAALISLVVAQYRGMSKYTKRVGIFFAACAVVGFAAQIVTHIASEYETFINPPFSFLFAAGVLGALITPFAARHFAPPITARQLSSLPEIMTDARAVFIVIGALAQLLAWIPVSRCTFAYHYFPTSFFLVLALAAMFDRWDAVDTENDRQGRLLPFGGEAVWNTASRAKRICVIFTVACVALFALYYPVLTGIYAPNWYHLLVRWFPSWPL